MTTLKADLRPQLLDIALYAGDGSSITFNVKQNPATPGGPLEPVDITGTVLAQIKVARADTSPVVTFAVDLSGHAAGVIILTLSGTQTRALSDHSSAVDGKFSGVWDVQWTPSGGQPRTLVQGSVECNLDVSR